MASWREALARTRRGLAARLRGLFTGGGRLEGAVREELEEALLAADVPLALIGAWLDELATAPAPAQAWRSQLRARLLAALPPRPFDWQAGSRPRVILVVGVNGAGKTTSCAKLARCAQRAGLKPLLCAADTFRAAGDEQLRLWAERLDCPVVSGVTGGGAAAVAYGALAAAQARQADCLLIDTAGRMHTREPLMQELSKVRRALAKQLPRAPDETWIVLDATNGRNALSQAVHFHSLTPLTGVVVAKLDGSAKAGFVFDIQAQLGVPVLWAGLGEGPDDLEAFNPEAFVDALLGPEGEAT
ncbi:MAG: signal recognition particle-docking protein FtsY [Candidatus Marinimicrobia bacterium]|nr:signal recognition particle-docking protein FtsY [Candidatus Neomarinimicrobiota bacterium]